MEEENSLTKQNRRELFAVAAVAFVARHDSAFAKQFLVRVAGVPRNDLRHKFYIRPQAHACADLLIIDEVNRRCYVVEFKVHAPADEKQSPDAKAFAEARGYCSQMKQRFGDITGRSVTYTLFAKNSEFEDKVVGGVRCRARTWKELIPAKETGLVADLLDSLGEFGIPALQLRKVRSMKNAAHAQGAFDIYELLQSILTDFRASPMDVGSDEIYRWCGMALAPRKDQYRKLRNWLGHQWKHIGWVGYLIPKTTKKPELSIWLYFDQKRLENRKATIRNLKSKLLGKTVKGSGLDWDVIVSEPADRVQDEKEWFSDVLELVLKNAVPVRTKGR